jgi:hypothetical protein
MTAHWPPFKYVTIVLKEFTLSINTLPGYDFEPKFYSYRRSLIYRAFFSYCEDARGYKIAPSINKRREETT